MRLKDVKQSLENLEEIKRGYDFSIEVNMYDLSNIYFDIKAVKELIETAEETLLALKEWEKRIKENKK